ncbi:MAG: hypothetical protein RL551_1433 [Pseudomonadota bacterium]
MDFSYLIDLFLHLDKNLALVANQWGVWIYALLFAIIFVETGLVVMPFLPGDSLLFVAGAIAAVGGLDLFALMALLTAAAVTGDALNYSIGRKIGNRVFSWENSRWFNRNAFDKAHAFYEKYGPIMRLIRHMLFMKNMAQSLLFWGVLCHLFVLSPPLWLGWHICAIPSLFSTT